MSYRISFTLNQIYTNPNDSTSFGALAKNQTHIKCFRMVFHSRRWGERQMGMGTKMNRYNRRKA